MTELPAKFEPEAVRVKSGPPLATVAGLMLERVGAGGGAVTLGESGLEAQRPPTQAAGLLTCTATLPCPATSPASTAMESCVGEIRVTVRGWPPTVAVAPGTKPVPVTARAKAGVPAATLAGARLARLGVGLILATVMVGLVAIRVYVSPRKKRTSYWPRVVGRVKAQVFVVVPASVLRKAYRTYVGFAAPTAARATQSLGLPGRLLIVAVTVNPGGPVVASTVTEGCVRVRVRALVVPPPGLGVTTVMLKLVAVVVRSAAWKAAVSWVGPTKIVGRETPLTWTTDPFTKLLPLAVSVKAGPHAANVLGEMDESVGAGLLTLSVAAGVVPPPGVKTVML